MRIHKIKKVWCYSLTIFHYFNTQYIPELISRPNIQHGIQSYTYYNMRTEWLRFHPYLTHVSGGEQNGKGPGRGDERVKGEGGYGQKCVNRHCNS